MGMVRYKGKLLEELLGEVDIDPSALRSDYLKALEVNNLGKEQQFGSLKPWQEKLKTSITDTWGVYFGEKNSPEKSIDLIEKELIRLGVDRG